MICSGLLLLAIIQLPSGFYTFLRIAITLVSVLVIINEYQSGINFWVIIFGIILILFNPLIPVYLYDKEKWIPIDIVISIVFGVKVLTYNTSNSNVK